MSDTHSWIICFNQLSLLLSILMMLYFRTSTTPVMSVKLTISYIERLTSETCWGMPWGENMFNIESYSEPPILGTTSLCDSLWISRRKTKAISCLRCPVVPSWIPSSRNATFVLIYSLSSVLVFISWFCYFLRKTPDYGWMQKSRNLDPWSIADSSPPTLLRLSCLPPCRRAWRHGRRET